MAFLARPDGVVIHHESHGPQAHGATFVFFNPLTGDSGIWLQRIAPALEARGHGWLVFDMRGQKESPIAPNAEITAAHIVEDARAVIEAEAPVRPIYVGLSIGGLFAANVHLAGPRARAMLLINTLREEGPRLSWLNTALARCARTGGLRLLRDLYLPLLFGEKWLAANRAQFLQDEPYIALDPAHADVRLLASAATADWNLPWEKLDLPVIVMTGRQDRVFYEEEAVRRLSARLPNALRVDLAEAGHLIPAEDPEAVIEACLALAGRIGEPRP